MDGDDFMNDSVFHRLYEEYHNDVFRFLIYLMRDRTQAEDLVHEVYVRVLRAYAGFEGKSSEKTWLFSIAKNVAIDHFRKQSVRQKYAVEKFDWENTNLSSNGTLPEEFLVMSEEKKQLLDALETCTENQKMVIHMRFIQDFSVAESAEILGWTEGKVKTTQHRAIKALRRKLTFTLLEGAEDND